MNLFHIIKKQIINSSILINKDSFVLLQSKNKTLSNIWLNNFQQNFQLLISIFNFNKKLDLRPLADFLHIFTNESFQIYACPYKFKATLTSLIQSNFKFTSHLGELQKNNIENHIFLMINFEINHFNNSPSLKDLENTFQDKISSYLSNYMNVVGIKENKFVICSCSNVDKFRDFVLSYYFANDEILHVENLQELKIITLTTFDFDFTKENICFSKSQMSTLLSETQIKSQSNKNQLNDFKNIDNSEIIDTNNPIINDKYKSIYTLKNDKFYHKFSNINSNSLFNTYTFSTYKFTKDFLNDYKISFSNINRYLHYNGNNLSSLNENIDHNEDKLLKNCKVIHSRPPNVMIYTGSDYIMSKDNFSKVLSFLSQFLNNNCYAIYKLNDDQINTVPWVENTSLLVIAASSIPKESENIFLNYFQDGGIIISLGSNFDTLLIKPKINIKDEMKDLIINNETNRFKENASFSQLPSNLKVLQISSEKYKNISVISNNSNSDWSSYNFNESLSFETIASEAELHTPVVIKLRKNDNVSKSGFVVLSKVCFEKDSSDLKLSDVEFSNIKQCNQERLHLFREILIDLHLDCHHNDQPKLSHIDLFSTNKIFENIFLSSVSNNLTNNMLKCKDFTYKFYKTIQYKNDNTTKYELMQNNSINISNGTNKNISIIAKLEKLKDKILINENSILNTKNMQTTNINILQNQALKNSFTEVIGTISNNNYPVIIDNNLTNCRFDSSIYNQNIKSKTLGNVIMFANVTTSTMDIIDNFMFFSPCNIGLAAIASTQTHGQGRGGNVWLSPKGCAMFSVHVQVKLGTSMANHISCVQHMIALAAVLAVRTKPGYESINLRIKWPNDIYYGDNLKLGGVLVKSSIMHDIIHLNIGCGVNISNRDPTICINDIIEHLYNADSQSNFNNENEKYGLLEDSNFKVFPLHLSSQDTNKNYVPKNSSIPNHMQDNITGERTKLDSKIYNNSFESFNKSFMPNLIINKKFMLEPFTVEEFIGRTLTQLEWLINNFETDNGTEFFDLYYKYWLHENQRVTLNMSSASYSKGIVTGLDKNGFLLVRLEEVCSDDQVVGSIVQVQPDGNSFDMMKNLITPKIKK